MLKLVADRRFGRAIDCALGAQVGYLCKPQRSAQFEHLTRRARQRRLLALLDRFATAKRYVFAKYRSFRIGYPTCTATHVALKAFSGRADSLNTFSAGC